MSTVVRREREKRERREHFVDTAERLFLRLGHDGTSIEEIARTAEFSKRTVYLYFKDKQDLFHAVVLRGLLRLHRILAAASASGTGLDRLRALARAYYKFFQQERPYFDLLLDYEMRDYHFAKQPGDVGEYGMQCQEMNDRNSELVHRAVSEAIEDGADAGGLLPAQATLVIWAQVVGVLQLIARRESVLESAYGLTPEQLFTSAIDASLEGLFRTRGTEAGRD